MYSAIYESIVFGKTTIDFNKTEYRRAIGDHRDYDRTLRILIFQAQVWAMI